MLKQVQHDTRGVRWSLRLLCARGVNDTIYFLQKRCFAYFKIRFTPRPQSPTPKHHPELVSGSVPDAEKVQYDDFILSWTRDYDGVFCIGHLCVLCTDVQQMIS